jgi:hypothetical protein
MRPSNDGARVDITSVVADASAWGTWVGSQRQRWFAEAGLSGSDDRFVTVVGLDLAEHVGGSGSAEADPDHSESELGEGACRDVLADDDGGGRRGGGCVDDVDDAGGFLDEEVVDE